MYFINKTIENVADTVTETAIETIIDRYLRKNNNNIN
jgi:hypothetical protein